MAISDGFETLISIDAGELHEESIIADAAKKSPACDKVLAIYWELQFVSAKLRNNFNLFDIQSLFYFVFLFYLISIV